MTNQTATPTPWQQRGQRLGEISLILIGFTIPLSNALCTAVFPALAVLAWLMMRGWRDVPTLLRENRVALLCVALFVWLGVAAIYGGGSEAFSIWKKYRELALVVIYMGLAGTMQHRTRVINALAIGLLLALQISFMQAAGMLPMKHGHPVLSSTLTHGALLAWLAFFLAHYARENNMRGVYFLVGLVVVDLFFLVDSSTGVVLFVALGMLYCFQTLSRRGRIGMILGFAVLLGAMYVASPVFRAAIQEDAKTVRSFIEGKNQSWTTTGQRIEFYHNSLVLLGQAPWLGHGTGRFHEKYAAQVAGTQQIVTANPHNEYLMVGVQSGVVGVGLLLALLWALCRAAGRWQGQHRWLAQGMVVWLAVGSCFNSFILDSREGMLFALLAGVYGAVPSAEPTQT